MSTFRSMSTPRPVQSRVPRNMISTAAKRGANRRVNTGAMFSITLCFASTSQEAITTAPAAPQANTRLQKWTAFTADTAAGAIVYGSTCAKCHGPEGQGTPVAPSLWGNRSYNVGAGMARVRTAADFIRNNMPFDQPGTLTDQQAMDVAAYVSAHPRPDYRGKELDWPNGDPPPDVAYPTTAAQRKAHSAPGRSP